MQCAGTLRPDLIESASELASGSADTIKTHHNDTDLVRQLRQQVDFCLLTYLKASSSSSVGFLHESWRWVEHCAIAFGLAWSLPRCWSSTQFNHWYPQPVAVAVSLLTHCRLRIPQLSPSQYKMIFWVHLHSNSLLFLAYLLWIKMCCLLHGAVV